MRPFSFLPLRIGNTAHQAAGEVNFLSLMLVRAIACLYDIAHNADSGARIVSIRSTLSI